MKKWFKKYEWFRPEYRKVETIASNIAATATGIVVVILALAVWSEIVFSYDFLYMVTDLWCLLLVAWFAVSVVITRVDKHERKLAGK